MNRKHLLAAAALSLFAATPSVGLAQGSVKILAPANNATLDALAENHLVYDVEPGPNGDHVHVYIDGKEVGILRKLKGSYLLEGMASGKRSICVKVVNKGHVPIGLEKCVQVTVN